MKELKDKNIAVVFVGCGGTFWTASTYFSAFLKSICPKSVWTVDHDTLTEENTERQWCDVRLWDLKRSKAKIAVNRLGPDRVNRDTSSKAFVGRFQEWARNDKIQEAIEDSQVLVIVNVDNDEARFAIRDWCIQHPQKAIMVMSGCDLNYGQVYYGVYENEGALHDWKPLHPDVGGVVTPQVRAEIGCGAQSTLSNFLTGALFAPAIEEAVTWFYNPVDLWEVGEWYWRREEGKLRMWTQLVKACEMEEVPCGE